MSARRVTEPSSWVDRVAAVVAGASLVAVGVLLAVVVTVLLSGGAR